MAVNDVIVRLRQVGATALEGAMKGASDSIKGVGTSAETTSKQTDKLSGSTEKSGKTFKQAALGVGKWVAGAALVAKGVHYMHSAIDTTEELAKGTMRLTRTTGMDAEQASAWAEVTKVRGVNASQFQRGLVALSKQMTSAASGTKSSVKMFDDLGVSMDAIKAGDTQTVMLQMADGLKNMTNPAQRAAYAQKLLARQGQELLPLFSSGSDAIKEQLDAAKRYGAVIGGEGVEHTKEMAKQQRELKMASDGLKISLGEAFVPIMLQVTTLMTKLAAVMQPLLRSSWALKAAIVLLTVAFVTYKVAAIAATISTITFNAALLLIPLAIAALGVGLVIAYKKVGWFRDAVNATWSAIKAGFEWIKGHWVLLASILGGPFVAAAIQIVRNFDKIKHAASSLFGWFKGFGGKIVHGIADGIRSMPGVVIDALKSLLPGGGIAAKLGHKIGLWQHGGVVPHAQLGVVGERGPELVQLPGGARITPLPAAPSMAAPALAGAGAALVQTTAHFYLNNRLVATAVAQDTADRKARR